MENRAHVNAVHDTSRLGEALAVPGFTVRERCPACEATESTEIYSRGFLDPPIRDYLVDFYKDQGGVDFDYLRPGRYVLDECRECGLIYQRLILNDTGMQKLYDEWIDGQIVRETVVKHKKLEYYAELAAEVQAVVRYLGREPRDLKLLDFGMGWGEWCLMAKAHSCEVFGAELSDVRIQHAQAALIQVISWDEIRSRRFDFINTEQVFEHIPYPLQTLKALGESLAPGGLIRVSVPNGSRIKKSLRAGRWGADKNSRQSLNPVAPLEHINCYHYQSLRRMGEVAGLKPVSFPAIPKNVTELLSCTLKSALKIGRERVRRSVGSSALNAICFRRASDSLAHPPVPRL